MKLIAVDLNNKKDLSSTYKFCIWNDFAAKACMIHIKPPDNVTCYCAQADFYFEKNTGSASPLRFQWRYLGEQSSSPAFLLSLKPGRPRQRKKGGRGEKNHQIILLDRVGFFFQETRTPTHTGSWERLKTTIKQTASRLLISKLRERQKACFLSYKFGALRWCDRVASPSRSSLVETASCRRILYLFS